MEVASTGGDWMLSSDSHIVEPPNMFISRFTKALLPFAPRTVTVDGKEWWLVQNELAIPTINAGRAGDRFEPLSSRRARMTFDADIDDFSYLPESWLKTQERDGVWGGVLQCSAGLLFYAYIERPDVMNEICQIYNDFAFEFASYDPARIKVVPMLNIDDIDWAISEAQRTTRQGAAALMLPIDTALGYEGNHYDRLWSALSEIGLPIHFHVATQRYPSAWRQHVRKRSGMVNFADLQIRLTLTDLILGGVLDRFPSLRFVSVENEGGWVPSWLARMDWHYEYNFRFAGLSRLADGRKPSDYFRSNIWVSFSEDPVLVKNRDLVGVDRMLWGSDFPHAEGTFPNSAPTIDSQFGGVSAQDRSRLVTNNTANLYGFKPPKRLLDATKGDVRVI